MKTLLELYKNHTGKVSDKWSLYLDEYDRLFRPYRNERIKLLEIGIQNGGSLEIWAKYFPEATHIIGCDINQDCKKLIFEDPRISVVVGDASLPETVKLIKSNREGFNIIIEDGSHKSGDIIKAFAQYFPLISDEGIFVAEDLHCSYWSEYEGGIHYPYSSIAFFKVLADIVNQEHWGIDNPARAMLQGFERAYSTIFDEDALSEIHSVEFINSACVIRKAKKNKNQLGSRFIAGDQELVIEGLQGLHDSRTKAIPQQTNFWSTLIPSPAEQLKTIIEDDSELKARIEHGGLSQVVPDLKTKIVALESQVEIIATLQKQLNEVNDTVVAQRHNIGVLENQLEIVPTLQEQLEKTNKTVDAQKQNITFLENSVASYENRLSEILSSRSWKLTLPLRWPAHQVKRLIRAFELIPHARSAAGGYQPALKKGLQLFKNSGVNGIKQGLKQLAHSGQVQPVPGSNGVDRNDYDEWIKRYDTLTESNIQTLRAAHDRLTLRPLISVVMPTYNPKPDWLTEAIESVRTQIYENWELCIADDASTNPEVRTIIKQFADQDPRIKYVFREENGHISAASNSALALATGSWVALLDHDDCLRDHSLLLVAKAINENSEVQLIYSDEDKIDEHGNRFGPYFKSNWNPDLFYSHNMFSHLGVYKRSLLENIGGFRVGMEGAQDYDLALRCIERIRIEQIVHLPYILYHWRVHSGSTAMSADAKPYAMMAGERAINEHFLRTGIKGKVSFVGHGYNPKYELPTPPPLVSIIIPTRNSHDLVRQCIYSIRRLTTYPNYEILLVDNGSDDPESIESWQTLKSKHIVVLRDDEPFNYSALNNKAATIARGEVLVLLNNDTEIIESSWLDILVSHAMRPGVGPVGAKLLYPDQTLQHAGVVLGLGSAATAGHAHHKLPECSHGYFGRASLTSNFSAVTGACLAVRRDLYFRVGGLDEENLRVAFSDVDFCLKLREKGFRCVYAPNAVLYHHESKSRGLDDSAEKITRFKQETDWMWARWKKLLENDPCYSPNLTLEHGDFSLAWPPRITNLNELN